jgi:amino acid permease
VCEQKREWVWVCVWVCVFVCLFVKVCNYLTYFQYPLYCDMEYWLHSYIRRRVVVVLEFVVVCVCVFACMHAVEERE